MLDTINKLSRILWDITKFLALVVAVAILISMLFGNNVPFFGGILAVSYTHLTLPTKA